MRFFTETLAVGIAAGSALLVGQATDLPNVPGLEKLNLGNLTATGILGWYAWHTASRTIPGLVKDFREESKEHREAFKEEMRIERESHRSAVDSLRASMEKHQ